MSVSEKILFDGAAAIIYRLAPDWDGLKSMAIGTIELSSLEAGLSLLQHIEAIAKNEGFGALIGPMDGSTWHKYRLIWESDDSPSFMMEPTSGIHDLTAFEKAGFASISQYVSSIADLTDTFAAAPLQVPGISIENWDGQDGEMLIRHLFEISSQSFANNRFYTPISFDAFLGIYRPILPFIQKEHVLFARGGDGQIKGFLFGTPNFLDQSNQRSVILKTYASNIRGVGHMLADSYHRRALDMGFSRVIHALMHESNISKDRSEKHKSRIFRKYALMGKRI
jgi:hypothetical protein